jgi:hypothetical protein
MQFTPHQEGLVARAKAYPFGTQVSSYLFVRGECWPVQFYNEKDPHNSAMAINKVATTARELFIHKGVDISSLTTPRIPVLASGSNASPIRLQEKYRDVLDRTIIPVIRYSVANLLPVFSAKFASYGSITATLQQVSQSEAEIYVTFLTLPQLERMHQTEAIGDEYDFAQLNNTPMRQIASEPFVQKRAYAYLSRNGVFAIGGKQFTLDAAHGPTEGFTHKTQEAMLAKARDLLHPQQNLELFILENVTNDTSRRRNNFLLQSFSRPFDGQNMATVSDPLSTLF